MSPQPAPAPAPAPSRTPAPPPAGRAPLWLGVVPLLLALLAQAGALGGGFVLDDVPVVRDNAVLERGVATAGRVFREPSWPGEQELEPWRPLTLSSLALDLSLFGGPWSTSAPQGIRLVQVLLHGLAAALLLSLLRAWLPARPVLTLSAALLFAVHPLASFAVGAAVGRADVLGLVFALAALRLWWAYAPGRPAALPLAVLALLLALLCKEAFAGLPLVALLADRGLRESSLGSALRRRAPGWLLLAAALLAWGLLWPGPGQAPAAGPGRDVPLKLLLGLEGLGRAALGALLPVGLLADRGAEALGGRGFVLAGAALYTALVTALVLLAAWGAPLRGPRGGVLRGVLLALGALALPAALTLPTGALLEPRAHYLLLPALCLGLALLVEALLGARRGPAAWAGGASVVAAGAALLLLSHAEARAAHDDTRLHEHLLARDPGHGRAMLRMARRLTQQAERERVTAGQLASGSPEHAVHLAAAVEARQQAVAWVARAVRMPGLRDDPEAWLALGLARLEADDLPEAERALRQARRLEPLLAEGGSTGPAAADGAAWARAARLYAGLGRIQAARGQRGLAANDFEQVEGFEREAARRLRRAPDYALLQRAAAALANDGRYGAALPLLKDVAVNAPEPALRQQANDLYQRAQRDVADLLEKLLREAAEHYANGEFRSAVEAYEEALRASPDHLDARLQAARLRGRHFGNYVLARTYVEEGLERLRSRAGPQAEAGRARLEQLRADLERWAADDDGR